jgi:chaperonin GroES
MGGAKTHKFYKFARKLKFPSLFHDLNRSDALCQSRSFSGKYPRWHPHRSAAKRRWSEIRKERKMAFRPLHDRVVIRRLESEEKTRGGIIIPDTAKEKPQEGAVVAVGPGLHDASGKLVPLDVKAGDRVLFGKWSGTEIKIDGEDLLIVKEADILGVVA